MHSTKGSDVKYRESESAYSFHNCPNRSWAGPMRVWLREKYPVVHYQSLDVHNQGPRSSDGRTLKEQMDHSSCGKNISIVLSNPSHKSPSTESIRVKHTKHKPPNCSFLATRKMGMGFIDHELSAEEDRSANQREDGEQHLHRPFVCKVVCDFDFEGVERVGGDLEGAVVDCLHD